MGRYGELKLDSSIYSENYANLNTSISKENTWGTGINWYLNRNVKLAADFEQTKFRREQLMGQVRMTVKLRICLQGQMHI